LLGRLRRELKSPALVERFRRAKQHFSRLRKFDLPLVTMLILRGHKMSLQNSLNKMFSSIGRLCGLPTASALSQARAKLEPEIFVHLREFVVADFYRLYGRDGLVKDWRGHRLVAGDGTCLNLPDNPQTRAEFTVQTNQHPGAEAVQALSCVLYDPLNEVVLGATLGGKQTGEKEPLLDLLWEQTAAGDVVILDRNFAAYKVLAQAVATGREVVIRLPANSFKAAQALFLKGENVPRELEAELPCPRKERAYARQRGLPESIKVRFVRLELKDGEVAVLVTTLLDQAQYPAAEFKELYRLRWNVETFFDRLKNIFDAERFSGKSPLALKQDYYGVLFLATLEGILAASDQQALREQAQQRHERRTARAQAAVPAMEPPAPARIPQVNRAVSTFAMVDHLIELLWSRKSTAKVLAELHRLFRTSPTRLRPDRHFVRNPEKRNWTTKVKFQKYVKKLIA